MSLPPAGLRRLPGSAAPGRALVALLGVLSACGAAAFLAPRLAARREAAPAGMVALCGFGETCRQVGCHFSYPFGSATLAVDLHLENPDAPLPALYVPGELLEMRLDATDADAWFMGFELGMVAGCPFPVQGGQVVVTEPMRTSLIRGDFELDYLTHSCTCLDIYDCCGFVPEVLGSGSFGWSFQWQAPPRGAGAVTFYLAINSANGDGTPQFDRISLSSLVIDEEPCPPRVEDLRLRKRACDPAAPGILRAELYLESGAPLPEIVRETDDPALLAPGPTSWSLAPDGCRPVGGASLVYYSVTDRCSLGGEGFH